MIEASTLTLLTQNPYVQAAVAMLILGVIPNDWLKKIPGIGPVVETWLRYWATQRLKQFQKEREVVEQEAERIVREKEQAIKTGRLDQVSAKAQAQSELSRQFGLPGDIASRIIEASLNKVNAQRPLFTELVTEGLAE